MLFVTNQYFMNLLKGEDRGKGHNNGTFGYRTFFSCEKNCGVFAPFSRVRPVVPTFLSPSMANLKTQQQIQDLSPGDSVFFFINEKYRFGIVLNIQEEGGQPIVQISTVSKKPTFMWVY